jgi:hypothetical protein
MQNMYSNSTSRPTDTTSPKPASAVPPFLQMSPATSSTLTSASASSQKTRPHKRNPIRTPLRVRSSVCSVSHKHLLACASQTLCSGMMSTRRYALWSVAKRACTMMRTRSMSLIDLLSVRFSGSLRACRMRAGGNGERDRRGLVGALVGNGRWMSTLMKMRMMGKSSPSLTFDLASWGLDIPRRSLMIPLPR